MQNVQADITPFFNKSSLGQYYVCGNVSNPRYGTLFIIQTAKVSARNCCFACIFHLVALCVLSVAVLPGLKLALLKVILGILM